MSSATGQQASNCLRISAILVALLLAAHAPLLLNEGAFMDDWLVLKVGPNYVVDLDFMLHGAGHPVFFSYFSVANMTGSAIVAMQIMAIVAIVSGAVCLFLTAIATRVLSSVEAFGLSLIVWTYPGYQMWAGKGNAVYVFSFGMFCVGLWLFTCAFGARGGRHLIFRVMAALIFFFSFALNSIMVLYAFAMLGLFVTVWRGNARIQGAWRRPPAS